ncbi:MAG: hypothetical protein ACI89L_001663 [Phycisphaerales bacterium]
MSRERPNLLGAARAWLELARLSNAPTVLTNVLVGYVLGSQAAGSGRIDWLPFALAASVALVLYTAGMILNDAKDAKRDAESRPTRPIPSGRVPRAWAWTVGVSMLLLGVGFTASLGMPAWLIAAGIALCVLLYTFLHAGHAWSVLFMAACRGLLYPLGALAAGHGTWENFTDPVLVISAALGVSTLLLTLVARAESTNRTDRPSAWTRPLAWAVVFVPLCAPLLIEPPMMRSAPSLFFAVGFALWGAHSARAAIAGKLHVAIPGWIAGFCLFDGMILAMQGQTTLALACAGAFVLTHLAQRVLPGT